MVTYIHISETMAPWNDDEIAEMIPNVNSGAVKLYPATYNYIQSCTIMYNYTLEFILEIMHIYSAIYGRFY